MKHALLIILVLVALPFASAAVTPPQPPHQFFGAVSINGAPAPVGTSVTAQVRGDVHGSIVTSAAGEYGTDGEVFYVEEADSAQFDGEQVVFFVEGVRAATYAPYQNGHSSRVDLSVDVARETTTTSSGGSSGGSGGGGGVAGTASSGDDRVELEGADQQPSSESSSQSGESLTLSDACTPDWKCSEWTACVNGFANRKCIDLNQCGVDAGMPAEQRTCESPTEQGFFSSLTGAVVGGGAASWMGVLGVLALLGVLAGLYVYARRR